MNTEVTSTTTHATAQTVEQEACAALLALSGQAKTGNLTKVTELADVADPAHIAEHIRGMAAATMGHLSPDASFITRANATQWQQWALGIADGIAPAPVVA